MQHLLLFNFHMHLNMNHSSCKNRIVMKNIFLHSFRRALSMEQELLFGGEDYPLISRIQCSDIPEYTSKCKPTRCNANRLICPICQFNSSSSTLRCSRQVRI